LDFVCSAHCIHLHVMRRAQTDLLLEKRKREAADDKEMLLKLRSTCPFPVHKFFLNNIHVYKKAVLPLLEVGAIKVRCKRSTKMCVYKTAESCGTEKIKKITHTQIIDIDGMPHSPVSSELGAHNDAKKTRAEC
jgi:hypothetical protein